MVINEEIIEEENVQPQIDIQQIEPDEQAMQQPLEVYQEDSEYSEYSFDEAELEELTANEAIITSIEEANR